MLTIAVDLFEGPLDLLLKLIEAEELDITAVSLAKVTDQYLDRVRALAEDARHEEIADFLVVAAKLLLLKSRTLLPSLVADEAVEELLDLEKQLRFYREFVRAAEYIATAYDGATRAYVRPLQTPEPIQRFAPPRTVTIEGLGMVMAGILDRLKPHLPLKRIPIDITVTVQDRIRALQSLLKLRDRIALQELYGERASKSEVIASFLAALELVKQRTIAVHQGELFSEITVSHAT